MNPTRAWKASKAEARSAAEKPSGAEKTSGARLNFRCVTARRSPPLRDTARMVTVRSCAVLARVTITLDPGQATSPG